ncbi:hypothetical protein F5884DRAFT_796079 [Xylogone sp. PMI_703]|nr:hypothetical protein F5884DRAFT_796079 [Xylogone sp. PMI_703]
MQLHLLSAVSWTACGMDDGVEGTRSPRACLSCRRMKRGCDRTYPKCALCVQKQLQCVYVFRRKQRKSQRADTSPMASLPSGSSISNRHPADAPGERETVREGLSDWSGSDSLATRFLDPEIFRQMQLEIPKVEVAINKSIIDLVGGIVDIQSTANIFFDTVHTWMPIISKKQFFAKLPRYLSNGKAELFLLILSMKLVSSSVSMGRTILYRIVKQFYFDIESSGMLSLQILQSAILIVLYELGHAIYPAALLSFGCCARYATALRIERTIIGSLDDANLPWIEVEECRRVWWSILLLDRFLNLADTRRQLITPEPGPGSYLPVDDAMWDAGSSRPEDALTLESSAGFHLGRFARFAQAACLLSQALHLAAEEPSENTQLQRTIFALVNVSEAEGNLSKWVFCTQLAVCYSAILLLEIPMSPLESQSTSVFKNADSSISPEAASALKTVVDTVSYFLAEPEGQKCDRVSPLLLHYIYRAASIYLGIKRATPSESITGNLNVLKEALRLFNRRWLVAGTYLSLLERWEIILLMQNKNE